jgi:D-amino-acid dehydrogenase
MDKISIIVVGAGIVGSAIALHLTKKGYSVTLIDRSGPASGASFGNAGGIVNNSCVPSSTPGIIFDVIRMLSQPQSAFSLRPGHLYAALPWMTRFLLESQPTRADSNAVNLHALTKNAANDWRHLVGNTELNQFVNEVGWLKVFESEKTFKSLAYSRKLMDRLQVPYEVLDRSDIQNLEPALAPIFHHGIFQRDGLHISNPGRLVQSMVDLMVDCGGTYKRMSAEQIVSSKDNIRISDVTGSICADKLIISTGAYSKPLAARIGDKVHLEAERGYHMMFPVGTASLLTRPVVNGESSFVLSPMQTGMRMTSQVEIAGVDAPADYRRVRGLVSVAKKMLPRLDTREQSVWMGCRPSLPDSLPVIGASPKNRNIIYAFGHQHLGMTLGPVTAYLVEQLIAGKQTDVDLKPYRIDRF